MGIFTPKKSPLSHIGKIDIVESFKTIRIHLAGLDTASKDWPKKAKVVQDAVTAVLRKRSELKAAKAKITLDMALNEIQINMWASKPELFFKAAQVVRQLYDNALSLRQHELLRFADFEELGHAPSEKGDFLVFTMPVNAAITVLQGDDAFQELLFSVKSILRERLPEATASIGEAELQPVLLIQVPWNKQSGSELDMRKKIAYIFGEDPLNSRPGVK